MIGKTSFSKVELAVFFFSQCLPRQTLNQGRRLPLMTAPISIKILRTPLALVVSFWIAGAGCMLGCGNKAHAAVQNANTQTVIAGPSCHSASPDCCAKKNRQATVNADLK